MPHASASWNVPKRSQLPMYFQQTSSAMRKKFLRVLMDVSYVHRYVYVCIVYAHIPSLPIVQHPFTSCYKKDWLMFYDVFTILKHAKGSWNFRRFNTLQKRQEWSISEPDTLMDIWHFRIIWWISAHIALDYPNVGSPKLAPRLPRQKSANCVRRHRASEGQCWGTELSASGWSCSA